MFFVDFEGVKVDGRSIEMTVPLRATDIEVAVEEATRLKAITNSSFGYVYALTEDKGHSSIEVVVVKGDGMNRTRFAADDLFIATHILDIMENGGILFPTKFIIKTV